MDNLTNMYNNNIIVLNRGDTFKFDLTLEDDNAVDGRYTLMDNDAVYFGVMLPGQRFEDALIKKSYDASDCDPAGNLFIRIEPEDTLDMLPGTYYYMVKLCMDHAAIDPTTKEPTGERVEEVHTAINKTKFIVCN